LGGGLAAVFNLEYGINMGNGSTNTLDQAADGGFSKTTASQQGTGVRTAIVGLNSKTLGGVTLGRQITAMHTIVAGFVGGANNLAGDITYSDVTSSSGQAQALRIHSLATRMNESLKYVSPTFSGLQLTGDFSQSNATGAVGTSSPTNSANDTGNQISNQGLMVSYTYGAFRALAGTHSVKSNANILTTTGAVSKTHINAAGLVYSAKGLVANYTFAMNKTTNDSTGLRVSTVGANKLGVSYAVTPAITPFIQYGVGTSKLTEAAPQNSDNKGFQIGSTYTLSKRTSLYGIYGNQTSKLTQGPNTNQKSEIKEFGLGVVHSF
jgi:predicted porin